MNILLWVLQALLALHTAVGAVWKFSNTAGQTMPSLGAIPNGAWIAMSAIELLCALGLIIPAFNKSHGGLVPVAAAVIALEMLLFSGMHIYSGAETYSPMVYWLVVAVLCGFIAYGRFSWIPFE